MQVKILVLSKTQLTLQRRTQGRTNFHTNVNAFQGKAIYVNLNPVRVGWYASKDFGFEQNPTGFATRLLPPLA